MCVRSSVVIALANLALLFSVGIAKAADAKIEEKIVGPAYEQGTIYTISPHGLHLASVSAKGSRFVVTIDGVEGEKFDEILQTAADVSLIYDNDDNLVGERVQRLRPVAFSPDGSRFAYTARSGKEEVVTLDGKELFRGPYFAPDPTTIVFLSFTPDGKHLLFYSRASSLDRFQLMIDGQPVTEKLGDAWYAHGPPPYPFFSSDGSHWGLIGNKPKTMEGGGELFLMIDGKDAGYTTRRARFTPDGLHVISDVRAGDIGKTSSLLLDGKPVLTVGASIDRYTVSPAGDIVAVASEVNGKKRLYLNGKLVDGTEDIMDVVMSPDGKHWAARCASSPEWWVVVDGKKQQSYRMVSNVAFTPDSSKCVYVAEAGEKKFVVINGEEDEGNAIINDLPQFGKSGNHIAYTTSDRTLNKVTHDGKSPLTGRIVSQLTLSPDGSRCAYYLEAVGFRKQLVVDGVTNGNAPSYMNSDQIVFSPDSKHVAARSWTSKGEATMYLDGRLIPFPAGTNGVNNLLAFTADSQHLLSHGTESDGSNPWNLTSYFLNGKRVARFRDANLVTTAGPGGQPEAPPALWEIEPDGTIVVIGTEPLENAGGDLRKYAPMKRITIIPPGTTIAAASAPPPAVIAPVKIPPAAPPVAPPVAEVVPAAPAPPPLAPAPATPTKMDVGIDPVDAEVSGLKINQPVQPFLESARKAFAIVRYDETKPAVVQMTNREKTEETTAWVDQDGMVYALRYMRKLHGKDIGGALDSLINKYGKPVSDSGPKPPVKNFIVRSLHWTKPGIFKPDAAGLSAELVTSPTNKEDGIIFIYLMMPGQHAPLTAKGK